MGAALPQQRPPAAEHLKASRARAPCGVYVTSLMQYLNNTVLLVRFYVRHLSTLYNLPDALKNPDVLARRLADARPFELKVPAEAAKEYNREMQMLAVNIRASASSDSASLGKFRTNLLLFFILRIACCACAFAGTSWQLCLAVAFLQFLILPYSLFVAVTQFVALFPPLFSGHIFVHMPLQLLADHLFPSLPFITISPTFIMAFFIIDFIQAIPVLILSSLSRRASLIQLSPFLPLQCSVCAFVLPASAPVQSASGSFFASHVGRQTCTSRCYYSSCLCHSFSCKGRRPCLCHDCSNLPSLDFSIPRREPMCPLPSNHNSTPPHLRTSTSPHLYTSAITHVMLLPSVIFFFFWPARRLAASMLSSGSSTPSPSSLQNLPLNSVRKHFTGRRCSTINTDWRIYLPCTRTPTNSTTTCPTRAPSTRTSTAAAPRRSTFCSSRKRLWPHVWVAARRVCLGKSVTDVAMPL